MKITSLLSQYLYTHQRLDLPGIGSFILDPASAIPVSGKHPPLLTGHIHFEYRADLKEPAELIQFISNETGKMKALASSDLSSFIELAQQFLNIGKPFTIEGIGTLVKLKQGEFEFTPAPVQTTDRKKEQPVRETARSGAREEQPRYESFLNEPKPKEGWRKSMIALFVLAGLALAVWGGYAISKNSGSSSRQSDSASAAELGEQPTAEEDSIRRATEDSLRAIANAPQEYKYVLEVTNRTRAFRRHNQLLTNLWKVHLETTDSVTFKLYMNLPVNYGDTTRIKDSLRVMLGRPVYIEKRMHSGE